MKMGSTFGKAATFLAAFLGVGFFAAALNRFLGWSEQDSGWKAGAVTLGAALLLFVGFKTLGGAKYANTILVGGLAYAGVQFLARPVDNAGKKLGDWFRSFGMPGAVGSNLPSDYNPMGVGVGVGTATQSTVPTAPAPAAQQPQQVTVINQAAKDESSVWERLLGTAIQAGGSIVSSLVAPTAKPAGTGSDYSRQMAYAKLA